MLKPQDNEIQEKQEEFIKNLSFKILDLLQNNNGKLIAIKEDHLISFLKEQYQEEIKRYIENLNKGVKPICGGSESHNDTSIINSLLERVKTKILDNFDKITIANQQYVYHGNQKLIDNIFKVLNLKLKNNPKATIDLSETINKILVRKGFIAKSEHNTYKEKIYKIVNNNSQIKSLDQLLQNLKLPSSEAILKKIDSSSDNSLQKGIEDKIKKIENNLKGRKSNIQEVVKFADFLYNAKNIHKDLKQYQGYVSDSDNNIDKFFKYSKNKKRDVEESNDKQKEELKKYIETIKTIESHYEQNQEVCKKLFDSYLAKTNDNELNQYYTLSSLYKKQNEYKEQNIKLDKSIKKLEIFPRKELFLSLNDTSIILNPYKDRQNISRENMISFVNDFAKNNNVSDAKQNLHQKLWEQESVYNKGAFYVKSGFKSVASFFKGVKNLLSCTSDNNIQDEVNSETTDTGTVTKGEGNSTTTTTACTNDNNSTPSRNNVSNHKSIKLMNNNKSKIFGRV